MNRRNLHSNILVLVLVRTVELMRTSASQKLHTALHLIKVQTVGEPCVLRKVADPHLVAIHLPAQSTATPTGQQARKTKNLKPDQTKSEKVVCPASLLANQTVKGEGACNCTFSLICDVRPYIHKSPAEVCPQTGERGNAALHAQILQWAMLWCSICNEDQEKPHQPTFSRQSSCRRTTMTPGESATWHSLSQGHMCKGFCPHTPCVQRPYSRSHRTHERSSLRLPCLSWKLSCMEQLAVGLYVHIMHYVKSETSHRTA